MFFLSVRACMRVCVCGMGGTDKLQFWTYKVIKGNKVTTNEHAKQISLKKFCVEHTLDLRNVLTFFALTCLHLCLLNYVTKQDKLSDNNY